MRRTFFASLVLSAAAGSAAAATWSVPGLANISGRNNTHFSSDLKVLNRGTAPTTVRFEIILLSSEAPPAPVTRTLGAGQTFVATNALQALFGLAEKAGTVRVTADQPLLISGRTYNDANPAGTFGTNLNAVPDEELLTKGDVGHAPWVSESPDSSVGFRTNVGVFLLAPNSSVDVVLFDAAGTEKGRTTVSGGPLAFQTSVSAMVPGGLPIGRAEFQVNAGNATGYLVVNDNVTGDAIVVKPEVLATGPIDAAINGVAHAPGRENTYYVTDVRLYNPSGQAAPVTVVPLSTSGLAASASVSLAAGEVREVTDALGTLFSAPDGTTGSLRFQSAQPVVVLGRTSNVHRDGTPGTFGAFQAGRPFTSFPGPGTSNALIGLRQVTGSTGYRTNVGFLAGPGGVTATLVLKDAAGSTIATRAGAISMGPVSWQQPSLGDLFSGVTIPGDAVLEVQPTAGSVDAYASVIDNGTGDSVISAASPFVAYACPAPAVFSFVASPDTLAASGPVELIWYTSGNSVSISGVGSGLPAAGSATLTASATATFTLQASNACGSASSSARVVVGAQAAPVLHSASGSPGQLVAITPANLADVAFATSVTFTFPDARVFTADVADVSATGDLLVLVPWVAASVAPGYRTGPCVVTVETAEGSSPSVPFTILPLAYAGNSVADARVAFDGLLARGRTVLEDEKGIAGSSAFLDSLKPLVDLYETTVHRMLDDVAASGTATVPIDVVTADNPTPMTVTVTRADLDVFMALWVNLGATNTALGLTASAAEGRRPQAFCLTRDDFPTVFCKSLQKINPDNLIVAGMNNLLGFLAAAVDFSACVVDFAKWGAGTVVSFFTKVLNVFQLICDASPIYLDAFRIRYDNTVDPDHPAPPVPIRYTAYGHLQAHLVAKNSQTTIPNGIEQALQLAAQAYILKAGGACKEALAQLLPSAYSLANPLQGFKKWIGRYLPMMPSLQPERTIDVGPCDFEDIFLKDPRLADRREDGDFQLLYGRKVGKTSMVLLPKTASFFFLESVKASQRKGPYFVPIPVGRDLSFFFDQGGYGHANTTFGGNNCTLTNRVLKAPGSPIPIFGYDLTTDGVSILQHAEACFYPPTGCRETNAGRVSAIPLDTGKWRVDSSLVGDGSCGSVGEIASGSVNLLLGKSPAGAKGSTIQLDSTFRCSVSSNNQPAPAYGCRFEIFGNSAKLYETTNALVLNGTKNLTFAPASDGRNSFIGSVTLECSARGDFASAVSCRASSSTTFQLK